VSFRLNLIPDRLLSKDGIGLRARQKLHALDSGILQLYTAVCQRCRCSAMTTMYVILYLDGQATACLLQTVNGRKPFITVVFVFIQSVCVPPASSYAIARASTPLNPPMFARIIRRLLQN